MVGKEIYELRELYNIKPLLNEKTNEIIGNVLYVDNYENVVTNITKTSFFEFGKSRKFELMLETTFLKKLLNLIVKL